METILTTLSHEVFILTSLMLALFYPVLVLVRRIITPTFERFISKRSAKVYNILEKHNFSRHLVHIFISIYLIFWSEIFDQLNLLTPLMVHIKNVFLTIYATVFITSAMLAVLNVSSDLYMQNASSKKIPIALHTQIVKTILVILAIIVIITNILHIPFYAVFTSIGAAFAVIGFIFKDTLLGLFTSLQMTMQDVIRVGDWITVPSHKADGDIELISMTVVKIRNFDKTVTIIPTSSLMNTSFKNWRGMQEAGGRRIKRALHIDMNTVKFLSAKELGSMKKYPMLKNNELQKKLFETNEKVTNLTVYRYFVQEFLRRNQNLHQNGFTFLVRQLESSGRGIPIEIYVFTNDTNWVKYEEVQSDIFDNLIATLPDFDLKPYQLVT